MNLGWGGVNAMSGCDWSNPTRQTSSWRPGRGRRRRQASLRQMWLPCTGSAMRADLHRFAASCAARSYCLGGRRACLRRSRSNSRSLNVSTDATLAELGQNPSTASSNPNAAASSSGYAMFAERIARFFADEGVRAVIVPSGNNPRGGASGGTLYADWNANFGFSAYQKAHAMRVPLVIVAVEEFLRMMRLVDLKVPVKVAMNVDVEFTGDHVEGFNVLADIPGVDERRKNEVVMVTAHLDSWAAATGATDDGAGVVIAMEAMRMLHALHVQPARTIRVALWTGEEQGLLGSAAYVKRYIADLTRATSVEQLQLPEAMRQRVGPIAPKPDHARLSAVYNVDLGWRPGSRHRAGRQRGARAHLSTMVGAAARSRRDARDAPSMVSRRLPTVRAGRNSDAWHHSRPAGIRHAHAPHEQRYV